MKRASFLAFVGAFLFQRRRSSAQTALDPGQIQTSALAGGGLSLWIVRADGFPQQVRIGAGLSLSDQGGVATLNVASTPSSDNRPEVTLTIEPDGASWRIPGAVIPNPRVFLNGLKLQPVLDYTIESGSVVRPTPGQLLRVSTLASKRWTAY
jgi:hypothetical protein